MTEEEASARAMATMLGIPIRVNVPVPGRPLLKKIPIQIGDNPQTAFVNAFFYNTPSPPSFAGSFVKPWRKNCERMNMAQVKNWKQALAVLKTYNPKIPA